MGGDAGRAAPRGFAFEASADGRVAEVEDGGVSRRAGRVVGSRRRSRALQQDRGRRGQSQNNACDEFGSEDFRLRRGREHTRRAPPCGQAGSPSIQSAVENSRSDGPRAARCSIQARQVVWRPVVPVQPRLDAGVAPPGGRDHPDYAVSPLDLARFTHDGGGKVGQEGGEAHSRARKASFRQPTASGGKAAIDVVVSAGVTPKMLAARILAGRWT